MTEIAYTRLIEMLILPPGGPLLLMAVGVLLWHRYRKLSKGLLISGALLLYVLSTPLMARLLASGLEPVTPLEVESIDQYSADAIVVLAGPDDYPDAPEYATDTVGPKMLTRLRYAAYLQRKTALPLIVVGGDAMGRGIPAAVNMAQILTEEFGVPVTRGDGRSKHTFDNAHYAYEVMQDLNGERILLVTHAWHMRRAQAAFEARGLTVIPAATSFQTDGELSQGLFALIPRPAAMDTSYWTIREWLGLAVFGIMMDSDFLER